MKIPEKSQIDDYFKYIILPFLTSFISSVLVKNKDYSIIILLRGRMLKNNKFFELLRMKNFKNSRNFKIEEKTADFGLGRLELKVRVSEKRGE